VTEQQSESRDSSTPEPEAAHKLSASEKIFVRLSSWQTILSVVGLFVAVDLSPEIAPFKRRDFIMPQPWQIRLAADSPKSCVA
jgi:hypothetical protein